MHPSIQTSIVALITLSMATPLRADTSPASYSLDACNVVWESPSQDSSGSLPIGNSDIGANVWVEPNGDLVLYISKTDAWSENGSLLKLGRVRNSRSPCLIAAESSIKQTLTVDEGVIRVESRDEDRVATLTIWVDAHHPVIRIDGTGVPCAGPLRNLARAVSRWSRCSEC